MAKPTPPEDKPGEDAPAKSRDDAAAAVGVKPDEVLAYKDYGTHLVVTTVDGRKLDSRHFEKP